jgi:hypothetical protein
MQGELLGYYIIHKLLNTHHNGLKFSKNAKETFFKNLLFKRCGEFVQHDIVQGYFMIKHLIKELNMPQTVEKEIMEKVKVSKEQRHTVKTYNFLQDIEFEHQ